MKTTALAETRSDPVRWLRGLFAPGARPAATQPEPMPEPAPAKGQTILVVDDDPVFLRATVMKLESSGFTVIAAKDGSEAIQLARQKKPDLLVLDMHFPPDVASGGSVPWDGFRIMSWMRRFDGLKQIPIVIASVGDPVENTRLAISAGAAAFFHKQMNPNQLIAIVNSTLARAELRREPALNPSI